MGVRCIDVEPSAGAIRHGTARHWQRRPGGLGERVTDFSINIPRRRYVHAVPTRRTWSTGILSSGPAWSIAWRCPPASSFHPARWSSPALPSVTAAGIPRASTGTRSPARTGSAAGGESPSRPRVRIAASPLAQLGLSWSCSYVVGKSYTVESKDFATMIRPITTLAKSIIR